MVFFDASQTTIILLEGLFFGGILSLIAVGLTLIFGVSRVLNISHGDFLFLGGAVTVVLYTAFKLSPFLSVIVVVPLFAGVGILFNLLMRKPMSARTQEVSVAASVLVTLGVSNIIEGLGSRLAPLYGYNFFHVPSSAIQVSSIDIAGVTLDGILVISFFSVIAITIIMSFLVYRTEFGATMRASMMDREVSLMLGLDMKRISIITFMIGIALAAVAGTIDVLWTNLSPSDGLLLTISALTVVILGGLGSFYGALIGGFIIGLLTNLVVLILTDFGFQGSEWAGAVPLVVLILVLIAKPTGLLKR